METITLTECGITFMVTEHGRMEFGSEQDRWEFRVRKGLITQGEFFAKADAEGWVTA